MPIQIHGKDYVTVAERVKMAHEQAKKDKVDLSITTELISTDPIVVFKATVAYGSRTYTGYSAAMPGRGGVEKASPYETGETSSIGRALGFAGFGVVEGIASADEVIKAQGQSAATMPPNGPTMARGTISLPQLRKIAVLLKNTQYGNIERFEADNRIKLSMVSKEWASNLIKKLEEAEKAAEPNEYIDEPEITDEFLDGIE